ncbi:MAG TPA: peptidoglycan-binding protein, partial [Flavisolibacter sp.]|nr:peptidoglycan-binding protein [Flavisolibacter sp.]
MKKLVTLLCLFYCFSAFSQITPSLVRKALSEATGISFPHLHDPKPVERFYQENEYRPVWLNDTRSFLQKQLITLLYSAPEFGLDTKDYQLATLQELTGLHRIKDAADSAFTELILTDALLHFLKDLHSGTQPPLLAFEGYRAAPDPLKAVTYLSTALEHESLEGLAADAEPEMPAYQQAKRLFSLLSTTLNSADFTDILIRSDLVSNTNIPLLTRLQQFGFLDSTHTVSDKALVKKVQQAQLLFNLRNDGILNPNTRAALNVSLRQRREEVKRALNLFR